MNIFFLVRGYPSARDPMWGCFERDQAEALAERGHRVTLLSVDQRLRFYWRPLGLTRRTLAGGITAYNSFWCPLRVSSLLGSGFATYLAESQAISLYERAVREQGTPDVIYAHYLPNIELGVRLKRRFGVPVVGIEHWSELGKPNVNPTILQRAGAAYRQVNQLVTVSSALAANVKRLLGVDSTVVNNMYGREFSYQPHTRHSARVEMLAVGSLLPIKGYATLLQALALLPDGGQPWRMRIVGGGRLHQALLRQIQALGLEQRVELLGLQPKQEIVRLMQESDLFVLSSTSETFGVAAVEALAVGLPVVATDCGGPRDFISPLNGRLTPVGDAEQMAASLRRMMEHLADYDRQAIAQDCRDRFSREAIARRVETVLSNVTVK